MPHWLQLVFLFIGVVLFVAIFGSSGRSRKWQPYIGQRGPTKRN